MAFILAVASNLVDMHQEVAFDQVVVASAQVDRLLVVASVQADRLLAVAHIQADPVASFLVP